MTDDGLYETIAKYFSAKSRHLEGYLSVTEEVWPMSEHETFGQTLAKQQSLVDKLKAAMEGEEDEEGDEEPSSSVAIALNNDAALTSVIGASLGANVTVNHKPF